MENPLALGATKVLLLMRLLEKEKSGQELTVREQKMKDLLLTDEEVRTAVKKAADKRNSGH